jgi:hypothetical protein
MKQSQSILGIFTSLLISITAGALTNAQPAVDTSLDSQVMIRTEARTANGESAPGYCNATLVSARILVTAAHCVVQSWFIQDNVIDVNVGHYKYITRPDGKVVRIGYVTYLKSTQTAQMIFSADMQRRMQSGGVMTNVPPEDDYAVVVLSTPLALPLDFPYRRLVSQSLLSQVVSSINSLSPTIVTVNPWEEVATSDTKRSAVLDKISWNNSGWFESKSISRVQEGDSGGGLLVKVGNEYQLLAVVKGKASSLFGNWDVYKVAVGKVCDLIQNVELNADEKSALCR